MPGSVRPDDRPEVLRATPAELEDPAWWRAQPAGGVVLYAWGRRRELPVALAIREGGKRLVSIQDSGGLMSPLCGFADWWRERWCHAARAGVWRLPWFAGRIVFALTAGWWLTERPRLDHCRLADVVGVVSPGATSRYRRWLRRMGAGSEVTKICCIPHPVSPRCRFEPRVEKEDLVVAIGRWTDMAQKRPDRLLVAVSDLLASRPRTRVSVIGALTPEARDWLSCLSADGTRRIEWREWLDHESLVRLFRRSRVVICPSAFESFHIAAAEGLCSGASVVSWKSPSLPSLRWFASGDSGALADRPDQLGTVLLHELARWDAGRRDPAHIARTWTSRLHAAEVARRIVGRCSA